MTTPAVVATRKSPLKSKTNITAALMGLFGLLIAFHVLPAAFDATSAVGGIVAAGSVLVMAFRSFTSSVLTTGASP